MSGKELSRRELLKRAGAIGAGAVAAGGVAGRAGASLGRAAMRAATPKRGGKITFALEQDPGHIAPYGGILTITRTASELMYESLMEWDRNLNLMPALASAYVIKDPKTIDFTI